MDFCLASVSLVMDCSGICFPKLHFFVGRSLGKGPSLILPEFNYK